MGLYKKDFYIVFQILVNMFRMFGFILVIPTIVAIAREEYQMAGVFALMTLCMMLVFLPLKRFLRYEECKTKHALISLALAWICISIVSSIPFMWSGITFIDSFFESFSGWTGTGLTMIQDPSLLPGSLNFFRGFIQWVGGLGIVVLTLLLYEKPKTAQALFLAEGRFEDFYLNFSKIARIIVLIFTAYTVIGIVALIITGVPFFDAVVNALTTISTGGYSTNPLGIGAYGRLPMIIAIVLMYLGGTSFLTHYKILKGRLYKLFTNPEIRFMFLITLIASAIVGVDLYKTANHSYYEGFFYIVAAITGTGAGTIPGVNSFPTVTLFVLILLMMCGATYGSTTGAIKIWRVMIIIKNIKREIIKPFYPQGTILPIKMGNNRISDEECLRVSTYALLYLALIAAGTLIFVFAGYRFMESFFLISSAQGNVGLNILTENYFNMSPILKLELIFHMLLGRLEIIPFLIMIRSILSIRD